MQVCLYKQEYRLAKSTFEDTRHLNILARGRSHTEELTKMEQMVHSKMSLMYMQVVNTDLFTRHRFKKLESIRKFSWVCLFVFYRLKHYF